MACHYAGKIFWLMLLFLCLGTPLEKVFGQEAIDPGKAIPSPLESANTASPRDTLRSFLKFINDGIRRWRDFRLERDISLNEVRRPVRKALHCLDLSELPEASRYQLGLEKVLLLKEILDRVAIPPWEAIPGEEEVAEKGITRWTLPGTELNIVRVEEGARVGEFLFSVDTVRQLELFYELARDLPYKPGSTEGIYESYLYGPGPWIPLRWIMKLPDWAKAVYLEEPLWQWIALVCILVIASTAVVMVIRWARHWDKSHRHEGVLWRFGQPLAAIGIVILMAWLMRFIDDGINITGQRLLVINAALNIVRFAALAWLASVAISRIGQLIIAAQQQRQGNLNTALVQISCRILAILVVVYIAIYGLGKLGVPLAALLTGLGVGGLAIALAVRPLLENIVGGFILFLDKPVRVGDFCRYGDSVGTVEKVGLRSTRVRNLDRTIVTIPNAEFSQLQLKNYAKRDRMLYRLILQLRYETTSEQLRFVLERLRRMLLGHPRVTDDPARVRFFGFGAYSLDLEIFAYVNSNDWGEYLGIREDLNLRIMDIVHEAGTEFAFPSQTTYFSRDSGLDPERVEKAQQQVEGWRESGQLPFPEFEKSLRWQLKDMLDFPPRGSPDFSPRRGEAETAPEAVAEQRTRKPSKGRWTFKWQKSTDKTN